MMKRYREDTPKSLGGSDVILLRDYAASTELDLRNGKSEAIDLPKSDVLQFETADGSIISARPSGTEPKIKFYCSVRGELSDRDQFEVVSEELDQRIDAIMKDLGVA